jgi:hypothetical protein
MLDLLVALLDLRNGRMMPQMIRSSCGDMLQPGGLVHWLVYGVRTKYCICMPFPDRVLRSHGEVVVGGWMTLHRPSSYHQLDGWCIHGTVLRTETDFPQFHSNTMLEDRVVSGKQDALTRARQVKRIDHCWYTYDGSTEPPPK